ncbi:Histidine kinase [Tenacibaculum sp. 190130A14a]|uniref:Histidine kinase n=1 Tax=Tenacibaculum polynesiense TaxID=3137857 RepID=A0ABM9PD90_9FLAO
MKLIRSKKHKKVLKYIIGISVLVPVLIVAYETIVLGKDNVVLLIDFPSVYSVLIILYYGTLLVLGGSWALTEIKHVLNLRNEKLKNELKYLKAQVSPHFFFNMLNNLYGSIDKDASKAKKIVLELSEMMRYSIYKGESDYVSLKEEVNFIENFISLQRLRYYKELKIDFKVEVEDESLQLMPLLFINLVENAFKHGVENLRENAYVYIKLQAKKSKVYFEVENNFDAEMKAEEGGVGLQNLIKRLDLVYANAYKLETTIIKDVYNVQLRIDQV